MRNTFRLATALLAPALLASCAGGSTPTPILTGSASAKLAGRAAFRLPPDPAGNPTLYVLNLEQTDAVVTIYKNGGAQLIRSIDLGSYNGGVSMTVAPNGLLYASATFDDHGPIALDVYSSRGAKLVRTFRQRLNRPFSYLTVDRFGNLYSTCGNLICEYAGGKDHVLRRLGKVGGPIATDQNGNVAATAYNQGQVFVYAPGSTEPYWETSSIEHADKLSTAFDESGNLYAGQFWQPGNVQVYAPGSNEPMRTITDGVDVPEAVNIDSEGNLYVLGGYAAGGASVTVYPPGASDPVRTITDGVSGDSFGRRYGVGSAMAFDPQNNLYVDNSAPIGSGKLGSVSVYAPDSDSPIRTITQGIDNPVAIAIGP